MAATFSHPAMVTSIVVCALMLVLFGRRPRMLTGLLPLALVAIAFVVARIVFRSYLEAAPRPGFEPMRIVWLVRSGLLPVFSLRGSLDFLERLLALGGRTDRAAQVWIGAGAWLAAFTVAAVLCLWRARTNGVRFLVVFLAIHLAALSVASGLSPRQTAVASVPAALLTACALRAAAERLAAKTGAWAATLARALPAVVVALLIAGAQPDHRTALKLHLRVADAWGALAARLRAVPPERGPFRLTVINMPAYLSEKGISAFAFQNGLGEMAHLTNRAVTTVNDLWRIPIRGAPEHIVAEVPWLTQEGLREQLMEPDRVVLFYEDDPVDVQELMPADVDRLAARWSAAAPD
jgi:hypothetical protein